MAKTQTSGKQALSEERLADLRKHYNTGEVAELLAHIDAQAERLEKATKERNIFRDDLVGSEAELAAAATQLSAWHKMFGTTQLTHALAERDSTKRKFDELVMATQDIRRIVEKRDALAERVAALEKVLKKTVLWLDRLASAAEARAKDRRFESLAEANESDAKNYRATAANIRAALDQKPKPEPPEYVAGPPPSAFPGW